MIRRPPRSTLSPTRRSSDLRPKAKTKGERRKKKFGKPVGHVGASSRLRSEEHTTELQSRPQLGFRLFFNDTATTEIYPFPYTTLFRSKTKGKDQRRKAKEKIWETRRSRWRVFAT